MNKWLSGTVIGLGMTLVATSSVALAAPAVTPVPKTTAPTSGQGLEISPPVIELTANPGQTVTATIRVRNVASGELIAEGQADDFGAGSNEDGQPQLLLNEQGETRYSLKYWIRSVPNLTLAPQELKTATVTIAVPANAEPGGHFGVIRFTAVPPNLQGTGVSLSASVGTLILLRVNGAVKDDLSVVQFVSGTTGKDTPFGDPRKSFEAGPVSFLVRLHNDGTVHEAAIGGITVTDTFGHSVATVPVNPKGGNVLPDSIRRFEQTLSQKKLFGHYTAKLSLSYLEGKKQLSATTSFWVIPWKLLGIIALIIVVLFFLIRIGLKRYNRHIIAQARKRR